MNATNEPLTALLVEDNADDAELIDRELRDAGFDTRCLRVDDESGFRAQLGPHLDVILSDFNLPRFSTPRALALVKEFRLEVPVVIVSGTIGEERAVEMVKGGAADYVLKENLHRLPMVVRRSLAEARERKERRRVEQQLRLHSGAIEAAAGGIMITDRRGIVVLANRAFCEMSGYTREELIGNTPRLLKSGEHDDSYYRSLWETIVAGKVWQGRIVNRRKDGSRYRGEMTITPVRDTRGEISHFIAVKQDVTERDRLEEQLRQAQKMESIGLLAGGVAHDFNNLLTVIQGHASMLSAETLPDRRLAESVDEIALAAERAASLTRQLLAFSRKQVFQPRQLDLGETLAGVTKMLKRLLGDHIDLQLSVMPGLCPVEADPGMIDQVLMNLAVNARDAMADGGQLMVRVSNEEIDPDYLKINPQARSGPHVCITVSDNGTGMPPEIRERIFEPFFTTKGAGKGTGLGLGTVYGIVRQHHGWINVYSEPGKGSVFRLYLPALEAATSARKTPSKDVDLRGGDETILVVEDDPALRALVQNLLERFGFNVLEADSGVSALAVWEQHGGAIDLLLTDIVMPEHLSGLKLAEKLREQRASLPIIFTSGYSAEVVGKGPQALEGASFLQKPYPVLQLIKTVRAALDRKPAAE